LRRAARVDANQEEVVRALRQCGISVEIVGLPLDLLIHNPRTNQTSLMEIKTEDGRLTKQQVDFIARWPGPIDIVRGPQDALKAVLGDALK